MQRFTLSALRGLAALALVHGAAAAQAAGYPAKPIVFIVPYTAGGTTDLVAHRGPEGRGETGPARHRREPSGRGRQYRHGCRGQGRAGRLHHRLRRHFHQCAQSLRLSVDAIRSDQGLHRHQHAGRVLGGAGDRPSIKVDSVKDLVAYAKQHPGTAFGTPGTGTSMHLAGVMFDQLTGAGMQHIPYKGSAQGINDLLGGHLPIMFDNLPARCRISSRARSARWP